MTRYIDKRCPCNQCFIQPTCTSYCKWFHSYRAVVVAEAEFFIMNCDSAYEFRTQDGQRLMTLIEQDIDIAYRRIKKPKESVTNERNKVKKNLQFLGERFDCIIENSLKTGRGVNAKNVSSRLPQVGSVKNAYSV
jgi:hypothetical protein